MNEIYCGGKGYVMCWVYMCESYGLGETVWEVRFLGIFVSVVMRWIPLVPGKRFI
jgi:hypothetical protein